MRGLVLYLMILPALVMAKRRAAARAVRDPLLAKALDGVGLVYVAVLLARVVYTVAF